MNAFGARKFGFKDKNNFNKSLNKYYKKYMCEQYFN